MTSTFYDDLADYFHLIYENWPASIERPADITHAWRAAQERRGFARTIRAALRKHPIGAALEDLL